jgi:hypothetical protein
MRDKKELFGHNRVIIEYLKHFSISDNQLFLIDGQIRTHLS